MKGLLGEEVGEGIAEVLPGDVLAEDGVPELFEEDEADAAVLEFLVAGGEGKGVVDIDTCGEGEGEFQRAQGVEDVSFFGGAEAGVQPREVEGCTQPEADGFAMQEFAIGQGGFDAMADGVTQIEEGADAEGFFFVFFDDAGFDGDVGGDDVGEAVDGAEGEAEVDFIGQLAQGVEHAGFADGGVLDHFGHAFADESRGEGGEGGGVDEDEPGLVEGADEVFAAGDVDCGLAAHGAIDLGHDAGGYLHEGDAAVVDAGDEACHVAHDTAAQGDNEAGAVVPFGDHFADDFFYSGEVFVGFSGGEAVQAGGVSAFFEALLNPAGVEGAYVGVGDDGGFAVEPGVAAEVADGFE